MQTLLMYGFHMLLEKQAHSPACVFFNSPWGFQKRHCYSHLRDGKLRLCKVQ